MRALPPSPAGALLLDALDVDVVPDALVLVVPEPVVFDPLVLVATL
jgi:hypothetical protein